MAEAGADEPDNQDAQAGDGSERQREPRRKAKREGSSPAFLLRETAGRPRQKEAAPDHREPTDTGTATGRAETTTVKPMSIGGVEAGSTILPGRRTANNLPPGRRHKQQEEARG